MNIQDDIYYAVAHRSDDEIKSFSSRYDNFQENLIPEIFKESLGWKVTKFKRSSSWGSSHVIYFVSTADYPEQVVFRANLGVNPVPEGVMEVEKLITRDVKKVGLRTNEILYSDISRKKFPFDFQIQKKLVGKDPEVDFPGSKEDYDRLSYQIGEYVARYHSLEYPLFGRFDNNTAIKGKLQGTKPEFSQYIETCLDDDLRKLVEFGLIKSKKLTQIQEFFVENKKIMDIKQGVLNHHDLADHNLMFDEKGLVGLFDWEAAVIGDPVLDLASCPTWRTIYPREEQLLAGYASIRTLPELFLEKKAVYMLRTMIWKAVYAVRMDIMTPGRMQKFHDSLLMAGIDH
ncbi:MAG: aminoglycoside phosphotransferase family protein [Candidatus Pacebacteria bacterium]|jgi:hypothetical protein|nr:aminoglycoside phosphotransferase family protein [Candidatus Paceibacterota bacterium]MBT4651855.1 aminoglycoside phosphotransferase family protein [Candidatus Paceibacterota bacterium]MBT6755674.1 aminoglycoside phosphotransferase family protein [Candidatus Paceibacterota bacterium]MBT6921180.1 aminoglycoside phosphotransferase family protein [Candidatus Paceibacterota bacterium]